VKARIRDAGSEEKKNSEDFEGLESEGWGVEDSGILGI